VGELEHGGGTQAVGGMLVMLVWQNIQGDSLEVVPKVGMC
jgi:hypothetical protein